MAFHGLKSGDVFDVDLYNDMISILNFHKKANFVIASTGGTTHGGTNTTQRISFAQEREFVTIITIYTRNVELEGVPVVIYPRITKAVDHTDTLKSYLHISDTQEVINLRRIHNSNIELYICKTKYSTTHRGFVWLDIDIIAGEKDFSHQITQFLVAQHEDTESLLPFAKRGTIADTVVDWEPVRDFINSNLTISYCQSLYNTADEVLERASFKFNDEKSIKGMHGFFEDILEFRVQFSTNYENRNQKRLPVHSTETVFAKGIFFDNFQVDLGRLNEMRTEQDMYLWKSMFVAFYIKMFTLRTVSADMSLSSVDLFMLRKVAEGLSHLNYGRMSQTWSDLMEQSTAMTPYIIKIARNSGNYFTIGTDIKIFFEVETN